MGLHDFVEKDLDIAIVKATNHVESPPKERHVRSEFISIFLFVFDCYVHADMCL